MPCAHWAAELFLLFSGSALGIQWQGGEGWYGKARMCGAVSAVRGGASVAVRGGDGSPEGPRPPAAGVRGRRARAGRAASLRRAAGADVSPPVLGGRAAPGAGNLGPVYGGGAAAGRRASPADSGGAGPGISDAAGGLRRENPHPRHGEEGERLPPTPVRGPFPLPPLPWCSC